MLDNETLRLLNRFASYEDFNDFFITPAVESKAPYKDKEGEYILWASKKPTIHTFMHSNGEERKFEGRGRWFVGKIETNEIEKLGFRIDSYFK